MLWPKLNISYRNLALISLTTFHYSDVIMSKISSQITSLTTVYSTVHSGTDKRKHQSSASLAFVRRIRRWPVNSPHKGQLTRKMFPFDDVIMSIAIRIRWQSFLAVFHILIILMKWWLQHFALKHNTRTASKRFMQTTSKTKYITINHNHKQQGKMSKWAVA